jgi:hypothetical protein
MTDVAPGPLAAARQLIQWGFLLPDGTDGAGPAG